MEPRHVRRHRGVHARCGRAGRVVREEPRFRSSRRAAASGSRRVPGLRPVAFETITTQGWSQRVAFCLPEAESAMSRRAALTELGPDNEALRAQDRGAVLFDLGLGVLQVDCCIRTRSGS